MWDPQVPALAERYRVVTYDTRGHGDSPAPPGPYSLDDLVDDLVALLDEVGAERAHVAGLSLGGMTAMRLAAREPERVHRLAVLCTSAKPDPQPFLDRAAAVRSGGTAPLAPDRGQPLAHPAVRGRAPRPRGTAGGDDRRLGRRGVRRLLRGRGRDGPPRGPRPDHRADAGGVRGGGRRPPAAAPAGHRRRDPRRRAAHRQPRRAPGQPRADRARSPARCWATSTQREPPDDGADDGRRAPRRRDADPAGGARRRARRPRGRGHDAVHGRLPGLHHPHRVGRPVAAARPGPPRPQPA